MIPRIRRARRDDAEFLGWAMFYSSRGHLRRGIWDLLIGADEAGCREYLTRLAVAEPRSLCHYESFWVAETEGRAAAALCSFHPREGGWAKVEEAMRSVQRDLKWTDADIAESHRRMAPVWACYLPDVGADWGIESVATRPEFRGRGLAAELVHRALGEGRERGSKLAQVATYLGNSAARSLYERCGFRFSDEKRCAALEAALDAPGFMRLVRDLEPMPVELRL